MKFYFILTVMLASPVLSIDVPQGAFTVSGRVFFDGNRNGIQDDHEKGLAGIRILANRQSTTSGINGEYSIQTVQPCQVVSVSFPSGSWPTGPWFKQVDAFHHTQVDFALHPSPLKPPFLCVQFTDTHSNQTKTMPLMRQECEAMGFNPAFYICTGDMRSGNPSIHDESDLSESFGRIRKDMDDFPSPIFMLPGNHDTVGYGGRGEMKIKEEDQRHPWFSNGAWDHFVCPSDWSFCVGDTHFIGVSYGDYIQGKWEHQSEAKLEFIEQEKKASSCNARSLLFTHDPELGNLVDQFGLSRLFAGHTHTEGVYYRPSSDVPEYDARILVSGVSGIPFSKGKRRYCQDGRPMGYRLIVVEEGRIDSFYKAFDEVNTIMVNIPRRHVACERSDRLFVEGQAFDPHGEITSIRATLGGTPQLAHLERKRLWVDFTLTVDTRELHSGFHILRIETMKAEGSCSLEEAYLVLTDRIEPFLAQGCAQLELTVSKQLSDSRLLFNGTLLAILNDEVGETLEIEIPADQLQRLNMISLEGQGCLSKIRMEYAEETYLDQHRVFAWMNDASVDHKRSLYFDLNFPGEAVQWEIKRELSLEYD